jgi:hypothetical protein
MINFGFARSTNASMERRSQRLRSSHFRHWEFQNYREIDSSPMHSLERDTASEKPFNLNSNLRCNKTLRVVCLKIEIINNNKFKSAMGNSELQKSADILELLRITNYAAVADIGYIKLFDILNRNHTNYTRGYDHLMV